MYKNKSISGYLKLFLEMVIHFSGIGNSLQENWILLLILMYDPGPRTNH